LKSYEFIYTSACLSPPYHTTGGENVFTVGSYGEAAVMRSTLSPPVGGAKQL
jgi:hypothetical protein